MTNSRETSSNRRRHVDSLSVHDYYSALTSDLNHRISRASSRAGLVPDDGVADASTQLGLDGKNNKASTGPLSSQSRPSRITYARHRSFLSNASASTSFEEENTLSDLSQPSSREWKLVAPPSPVSLSMGDDEVHGAGRVRNIHELRRAGENVRFQGIVDTIFEDLEDPTIPVSVRQHTLIQLCEKLMERHFAQQFVESRSDKRLASCMTDQSDVILAYLAACAYGLILSTGPLPPAVLLSFWPQILALAPFLFDLDEDILPLMKKRRLGLSKGSKAAIEVLTSRLRGSTPLIDQLPSWLSPQRIALQCIQLTICKLRESRDAVEKIPESLLSQLIDLLFKHSSNSLNLNPGSIDFLILELTLSILEAYTTLPGSLMNNDPVVLEPLAKLNNLLPSLNKTGDPRCEQLALLYIRLLLNITNNNPSLCKDFSTPGLVLPIVGIVVSDFPMISENLLVARKHSLDIIILALGALINLTEESGACRRLFYNLEAGSQPILDCLVGLFSMGLDRVSKADSVVQTHFNVAFGYLAILLSTLCLDAEVRLRLRDSLNGTGLTRVLAAVDEFVQYHREVDEQLHEFHIGENPLEGFTSRLQDIVNQVRRYDGNDMIGI